MKRFLHRKLSWISACLIFCCMAFTAEAQYCTPEYSTATSDSDYLDIFDLGSIHNESGLGVAYNDFTALSTDLTAGTEYTATMTNGLKWGENYSIWIDYDHSLTLDDDEYVGTVYIAAASTGTITFTVPLSADDGATRLRVRCIYDGAYPWDPCDLYIYGEAEDYTVNISGGGAPSPGCTDPAALNYDSGAEVEDGSCIYPYTIVACDYGSLMGTDGTTLALADDEVTSSPISIGFTFPFYGTDYTDIYIGANGFLTFTPTFLSACCSGQILPTADFPNTIFFAQEDLDPNGGIDGTITYSTSGSPGDRVFVLSYVDVPHYNFDADPFFFPVTTQVQLYESNGEIRIVTTEYTPDDGGLSTMGLNLDGSIAQAVTGRNSTGWSATEECISFLPYGIEVPLCDATTGPSGLYADDITATSATLHWDAVASASQYIFSIFELGDFSTVRRKGVLSNSYTFGDVLMPETTYGFRVKTVCYTEGTISPNSSIYYFTTAPLRAGEFAKEIKMYPNPNNGTFKLQLNGYANSDIDVYVVNTMGQVVYTNNLAITDLSFVEEINLNGIASGMYQLKVIDGENITTQNLIIE